MNHVRFIVNFRSRAATQATFWSSSVIRNLEQYMIAFISDFVGQAVNAERRTPRAAAASGGPWRTTSTPRRAEFTHRSDVTAAPAAQPPAGRRGTGSVPCIGRCPAATARTLAELAGRVRAALAGLRRAGQAHRR